MHLNMKKCKITVLKTTFDQELAAEYGAENLTPCPMLKEGQVFYADYAKPEKFLSLIHISFLILYVPLRLPQGGAQGVDIAHHPQEDTHAEGQSDDNESRKQYTVFPYS